jgi:hypothetical protein
VARSKILELPCGIERAGSTERSVEIVKLKGRIQRDIARLQGKKNPDAGALIDAILHPSLIAVGEGKPKGNDIRKMLIADRDWLLFELRKHTWGPLVTAKHICSTCDAPMVYENFDLNTLEVISLDDDAAWWDGAQVIQASDVAEMGSDERAKLMFRVYQIENEELEVSATFRYGTGFDQGALSRLADKPVEAAWKMMSLTCLEWRDEDNNYKRVGKKFLPDDFWADVDMDIVGWAQLAFNDAQPGVDSTVELQCEDGHVEEVTLNASDFFFPEVHQKR